jgi:hypothetical protein
MKLNDINYATVTRSICFVPTLGDAGDKSAFFRVDGHAQVSSPVTGASAGMATGHRPWSPPIT